MISIIIPVYNRVDLLAETIESVLAQSYRDFECIITDNCSTDGTYELALGYSKTDSRIRVIRNDTNLGPVRNWRAGVLQANSKWVKILFSDDLIDSGYLARGIQCLSEYDNLGAVYFSFRDGLEFRRPKISGFELILRACLPGNIVSCSPSAYILQKDRVLAALERRLSSKADLMETGVGYDFACIFDSISRGEDVALVAERLVRYRAHAGSLTTKIGKNKRGLTFLYCDTYSELIGKSELSRWKKFLLRLSLMLRKIWYRFRLPSLA